MRCWQTGAEFRSLSPDRMTVNTGWKTDASRLHNTVAGSGGASVSYEGAGGDTNGMSFVCGSEFYAGLAIQIYGGDSANNYVSFQDPAFANLIRYNFCASDHNMRLYVGTSTLVATTTPQPYADSATRWHQIRGVIADAGGVAEVRVQGRRALYFVGDTKPGATTDLRRVVYYTRSSASVDEFVVNSTHTVIYYSGGAAPTVEPTIGAVVTGTTSGATATLMDYSGDGEAGFLVLSGVGGGGPFQAAEPLTDTGGWAATSTTAELTDNCSWPNETYIQLFAPTGDGATTNWTPSAAVAHYTLVNGGYAPVTGTFLTAAAAGTLELLTFPALPADAVNVQSVCMYYYGRYEGAGLTKVMAKVRSGGTNYDMVVDSLPSTSGWARKSWLFHDPNTLVPWTVAGYNAAQFGWESRA